MEGTSTCPANRRLRARGKPSQLVVRVVRRDTALEDIATPLKVVTYSRRGRPQGG